MLNSGFAQRASRAFAIELLAIPHGDEVRIRESFLRCFARTPSAEELHWTRAFLASDSGPVEDRWTDLALALLNSNEFVYVP